MNRDDDPEQSSGQVGETVAVYGAPVWRPRVGIFGMGFFGVATVLGSVLGKLDPRNGDKTGTLVIGLGALAIAFGILVHHL